MLRTWFAVLVLSVVAGLTAWRLGGVQGAGVLAGLGVGGGLALLGALYQRHVLMTAPHRTMHAFTALFFGKLVVLVVGGLSLRYLPAAAERVDWRTFLVTYAAVVAVVALLGAFEGLRQIKSTRSTTGVSQGLTSGE